MNKSIYLQYNKSIAIHITESIEIKIDVSAVCHGNKILLVLYELLLDKQQPS